MVESKPLKRWPGYLLIAFFAGVAVWCSSQLYYATVYDTIFAGPKRRARWITQAEAPDTFMHALIVNGLGLASCIFIILVLARGLARISRTSTP